MPLYVYQCRDCRIAVEIAAPVDHAPPRCETCGRAMARRYTPPIVRIVGEGGAGKSQSALGNQHSPERDLFDEKLRSGELPYEPEDVIY
jgi:putative FmdB family regulatory protein